MVPYFVIFFANFLEIPTVGYEITSQVIAYDNCTGPSPLKALTKCPLDIIHKVTLHAN
jgi:hypothetical protein